MPLHPSRPTSYVSLLALAFAALLGATLHLAEAGESKDAPGPVRADVVNAPAPESVAAAPVPESGFAPQTRLGFTVGDQWEPAIAADRFGHVYVLYPQYFGVPGCPDCPSPTMILQISSDHGATWDSPRPIISPAGTGQWDAQIAVDPVDGQTVYAAWLQSNRSAVAVAKSSDFGATWSVVIPPHAKALADKPILAVRGPDVYVAYNRYQQLWVAASHDGGQTFTSVKVEKGKAGFALAGGGAVTPNGEVYFGWAGYLRGSENAPVNLYLTQSGDGGQTWTTLPLDVSASAPECPPDYGCGWAYLGAQATLASDDAGTVYALWNAGRTLKGPQRIYFARSADGGVTWSDKLDVSTAPPGTDHAFPAITAGAAGDVRIAWMDARAGEVWNTYYRRSTDGGATWSDEMDLSTYVAGYSYIHPEGFSFPFGDYFELAIDEQGLTHAVWGEGQNYAGPGSIWYSRGN